MKHEFHNPDNLTPEQVGEGYRLLLKSEIKDRPLTHEIQCWLTHQNRWIVGFRWNGNDQKCTYRVPLATWPLPGPKWQAEREALSRGECVEAQLTSDWAPDVWIRLDPNYEGDWDSLFAVRVRPWVIGNSVNGFTLGEGQKWRETREPQLTYHQWRGEPRDQEAPPTDNDAWESLLRTNANLRREMSELKKQRDALSSQLQGVITSCHLRGYDGGEPLGWWIEKQFEDARANLTELLRTKAASDKRVKELEEECSALRAKLGLALSTKRTVCDELQSKLTAAEARLAQLEWRPVSVIPTKEDANSFGYLEATDGIHTCHFKYQYYPIASRWTYWRPAALPESPDPIVAEFTKWWEDQMDDPLPVGSETALRIWKAAKKTNKEQAK